MIKVYKYGALAPEQLDDALAQMRLGHDYYNALVEAERARRKECHDAAAQEGLEGSDLYKRRAELYKEIKETRLAETRRIRGQFSGDGLYWGTYLLIERSFDQACNGSLSPHKPHFRKWRESSKQIGVQIQKGKSPEKFFRLRPQGSSAKYQLLDLRIGTGEKRAPVFITIPIKMHRPLPEDADVAWVALQLRRVADRMIWTVTFTVKDDEEAWMEGKGTVAIDIGWRVRPDSQIRMAYCLDDRGKEREVLSPLLMRVRLRRADQLAALRADRLNALWEERRGDLSVLGVNRKPMSVRHLRRQIDEDAEIPEWLDNWLRRDLREWRREANVRRRAVASRRDAVRKFVCQVRRSYQTVIVEDCNWKEIKEDTGTLFQHARRNEHAVAPGELSAALKALPGARKIAAEYTTMTCCVCGTENEASAKLIVTCESCGDRRDQDERACHNILSLHEDGKSRPVKKPTARKRRGRFLKTE